MDQRTITVMNWMAFMLLAPATLILAWKMVSEKVKGRIVSSDLITVGLLLGAAIVGVAELNSGRNLGWLSMELLVAQLILLAFLFKRLWSPLMQKLGG
jgi:hypothetical protein